MYAYRSQLGWWRKSKGDDISGCSAAVGTVSAKKGEVSEVRGQIVTELA